MDTTNFDRTKGLGGSDIPVLLGISPFRTAFNLYQEKIGEKDFEEELSLERRRLLETGTVLEDFVIRQFKKEHEVQVSRRQDRLVSANHDFLWATIDGMCENNVIEVKTTASYNPHWKNKVPIYVLAQSAYYANLANAAGFKIIVFFRDTCAMRVYDFARDGDLEKQIIDSAVKFWDAVKNRIPPEPTSYKELQKRFAEIVEDKKIIASEADIQKLTRMKILQAEIKERETEYEALKVAECAIMGDAPIIVDEAGNVLAAWAQRTATRVSIDTLKNGFKDVYEACKVKTTTPSTLI
ncbi:hypothetical protein GAMM_130026 [Gammaproteobacteria bacterium]